MPDTSPLNVWLDRDGALLRLRLNRPKANIVDAPMMDALRAALAEFRGRQGLLAALLDAEGPHFSFGASVQEHLPGVCAQMLTRMHALLTEMLEWPAPILVAVRGRSRGSTMNRISRPTTHSRALALSSPNARPSGSTASKTSTMMSWWRIGSLKEWAGP
jgi:cyclohexa-1,5-dienecarbonyl-CoA hydratase